MCSVPFALFLASAGWSKRLFGTTLPCFLDVYQNGCKMRVVTPARVTLEGTLLRALCVQLGVLENVHRQP